MRRLSLLFLLLFVAPLRAQLRFERPAADLGEVRGGPVCEHRFDFINAGTTPVEIVGVRRDCGCLEPVLETTDLPPGARGTLGCRIRTLGQPEGPRTWRAWVQYRAADELKEVQLSLSARIRNDVTVQPSILALYVENALRPEVVITDRRTPALRVTAVRASLPALKATLVPEGNGVTRIVLELAAKDLGPGRHEATLDFHTDDPYYRHLQIPVTLTRGNKAAVLATPSLVRVSSSQMVSSHLVRLRPHAAAKVVIATATGSVPGITCTWAAGPANDATLKIRVEQSFTDPQFVTVRLAQPSDDTLTIPVLVEVSK
jgi:hypothetical protein